LSGSSELWSVHWDWKEGIVEHGIHPRNVFRVFLDNLGALGFNLRKRSIDISGKSCDTVGYGFDITTNTHMQAQRNPDSLIRSMEKKVRLMDIPLGSSFIRLQSKDLHVHIKFQIEKRSPGDYCFLEYEVKVTERCAKSGCKQMFKIKQLSFEKNDCEEASCVNAFLCSAHRNLADHG